MIRVYVRLLDEGVEVFRPAQATLIGPGQARLAVPSDYDPEDEHWEFEPGSVVAITERLLDGEKVVVAVALGDPDQ